MPKARPKSIRRPKRAAALHPSFARVVRAFVRDERVTFGGRGFGSTALKLDGRIFAMLSRIGRFVVKLPRDRVAELVELGKGHYFDPVGGRPMKEWLALEGRPASWLKLAREAYAYARANARVGTAVRLCGVNSRGHS